MSVLTARGGAGTAKGEFGKGNLDPTCVRGAGPALHPREKREGRKGHKPTLCDTQLLPSPSGVWVLYPSPRFQHSPEPEIPEMPSCGSIPARKTHPHCIRRGGAGRNRVGSTLIETSALITPSSFGKDGKQGFLEAVTHREGLQRAVLRQDGIS